MSYPLLMRTVLLLTLAATAHCQPSFTPKDAERFARLALDCVHRPYPNKISHVLESDEDARTPRQLTPVFWGCYDWHSAVHGHWLLVRLCREFPKAGFVGEARAALAKSFTRDNVAGEVRYISRKSRRPFERPYGLAWLMQLCAELHEWKDDPDARAWSEILAPLEKAAAGRLHEWLPKLTYAIRTGEHSQTAFALGLILDWTRAANDPRMEKLVAERARTWHLKDRACDLAYEPGGQDFLSPCIAEADLMRRVLDQKTFAAWLGRFLPDLPVDGSGTWLRPAVVSDRTDGKLAHLDGLNLSRAWMLDGIATALPEGDPRVPGLRAALAAHKKHGLRAVTGDHYAGGHWLGSFAVYLVTRSGIRR